jgi:DNA polymerase I-like protein with 3'-5' exonuclease and polymerase domains
VEIFEDSNDTFLSFKLWVTNKISIEDIVIGYDVESNGLDAHKNNTILKIIGDVDIQFILHSPYCNTARYLQVLKDYDVRLLGSNIKFDLKFALTEDKIVLNKVYDVMIAEQRIYMKSGLSVALANIANRYLEVYPDAMDKQIREEFIGVDVKRFKVELRHLLYGASDVLNLFPIKEKQEGRIERYNLQHLIYSIEFPMISTIAKAEVTGFSFNTVQWLEIYNENLKELFIVECELDKEVRILRDTIWSATDTKLLYMKGGKWDNIRKHNPVYDLFNDDGTTNVLDLFGEPMSKQLLTKTKKKVQKAPNNINYGSDTMIMEIFGRLEQPLLTKNNTLAIPQFTRTNRVDKTIYNYQTSEPVLQAYLKELPNTIMKPFIELLLQHRSLSKATSTYGANFITYLNSVTGRLHTSFRQCFTATGRMASGGGKNEPDKPNFQNIPSRSKNAIRMRNCFIAREGYSIDTHDLSGAELIIMCSLSQDMKLLEASKGDMHSHVAQNCWRRIYNYRAHLLKAQHDALRERFGQSYRDEEIIKELNNYIRLSKTYVVDKACKDVRTAFKPMTFGVIYGMYAAKAGKTLNISKEEGQIVINFIKQEFPDVIRMVEEATEFAKTHGYLILNTRTNSRAWFPSIIEARKQNLDFSDYRTQKAYPILSGKVRKEESEARNIKIQGTQADMIKECTVELQNWINNNEHDITILSWVHDEIVGEHPNYLNGKSNEWKAWKEQGNNLHFTSDTGKTITVDNYPELKRLIMIEVCNRYLTNVTMDVDYDVEPFWTK